MRKLLQKLSRPSKKTGAPGNLTPDQFQSPVQSGDAGGPSNNTSASAVEEDQASIPTNSHEPSPLSPPVTKEREKHGLFLLYPESRSAIGDVDIVAVHGLGGDWEDTWTHAAGKSWLKNFLPSDFPNARIWSFGYDSSLLGKTVAGINDAAKSLVSSLHGKRRFTGSESKPVIFVAHSLGGIVVKQALILAIQRSDYWGSIATSTKGLVFFGVPHRGADKAYWAALVVRIAQFSSLGIRGNNKFVDSLKRNSAEFANISQAFIQPGARLTIRSFYETERMGNSLIVDQDSATIGTNNEIALPIWGDHRQICKFASSDSEQYENVLMALRDMIPGIGGEAASIGREPASRLRELKTKVDKYMNRLHGMRHQREQGEPHSAEHMWIFNMAQTKDWKTRKAFSFLFVLYDEPLAWQTSVAESICHHMRKNEYDVLTVSFPDLPSFGFDDWKALVPRLLLAQLISASDRVLPGLIGRIQSIITAGTAQVKGYENEVQKPWEVSFCSDTLPWQVQWVLLSCALQCVSRSAILVLTGLGTDDYESLVDCLKLLDSSLGSYYSENFGEPVLSHKMLITGKEIDKKLWHLLKMNAGKFCKIGVSDERDACLSSLLFTELHARRDRVAYSEENTSNWIWSNPTYQDWLKLDSGFLWIFGKAGSGKSTLGAYLQRSLSRDKDGATLLDFFYSARAGPSERGHVYMLRSVLYQMLHKSAALYPAFQGFYRKSYGRPAPQWTFEDLEQCMYVLQFAKEREMVKGCTYLLVIDGLDESEDNDVSGVPRERALNMLSRLCLPNGNHTFKIIALSRNETVIKRHIPTRHFLDMKDMNKRDIEQIIDADIKRMWQKIRHSADLPNVSSEDHPDVYESDKKHYKLDVIRQRLIDHADGVILWVVLVLRELGALFEDPSCTPTRILKALDQIPENLEDLYEDMFVRLRASPTRSHAKAALLFTWLLFAQSTLKVCEVRDIVAIFNWRISDPSATGRNNLANHRNLQSNDNWQPTKRLLEDLCGGFVEVIPQERLSSGTSPSDYAVKPGDSVQLIHQTAREFLLDPKSELKSTGALGTVDDIRWICVNYLELIFENPLPTSPAHEALEHMVRQLQESPLMGYILRTFPKIMDMQPSTRGKESSLLRQRVVDYANNAEQNRWSSLTWWLLRPWIERLFPTGAYKLEDSTPEELISVLKPDNIKSNLLRLILRTSVVDDEETAATELRRAPTVAGHVVPDFIVRDLRSVESSLKAPLDMDANSKLSRAVRFDPTTHADEEPYIPPAARFPQRGHLCAMRGRRYYHQAGLINKSFLLYAIFCAKRIGCSIALDILFAASSDSSGSPDKNMLSLLSLPWFYEDAGESVPEVAEICIAVLPFRDMADQCAHHQSKKDYIENWRDCVEEDVEEDLADS